MGRKICYNEKNNGICQLMKMNGGMCMEKNMRLWYQQPAEAWTEALPLGNGRIGAMVFGGVEKDVLSLNEDTLWSGYPRNTNNMEAGKYFRESQRLIAEGKYKETTELFEKHMSSCFSQSYQPLGDLEIHIQNAGEVKDYERSLSLDDALCRTQFTLNGVAYAREAFLSYADQCLVMRIWASQPGCVDCDILFKCPHPHEIFFRGHEMYLKGICPSHIQTHVSPETKRIFYEEAPEKKGIRFAAAARITGSGGYAEADGEVYRVRAANEVVIKMPVRTSFRNFASHPYLNGRDEEYELLMDLRKIREKSYEELLEAHLKDYRPLFQRVKLDLNDNRYEEQPTDLRLRQFDRQQDDRGLCELIFQYGRYLMIAASRPGSQPMNLQGIWNPLQEPPWCANYTVNINTEMNYWPAECCNLSEMHEPLFRMVEELMQTGAETAKIHYNARGAVAHHNVDLWRMSNPVGEKYPGCATWAFWPMGFGWLCQHLYEHYAFTGDLIFLREKALPPIREAARFYLDVMAEDEEGRLFISPGTSPENSFIIEDGKSSVAKLAAMSQAIVREILSNYLKILDILGMQEEMQEEAKKALPRLFPFQIGSRGQLLEWDQEFEEAEVHHRHVSHLYGLHPGHQITPQDTPELAEACKKTLEIRGDDGTGWSLGWKINFWARLQEGDHALKLLKRQLRFVESTRGKADYGKGGGTYMNLFDAHPPFQIDGNFGACAGIAEMFLQSDEEKVLLLPALPQEWQSGSITGLKARNGLEADIYFDQGNLERAVLRRTGNFEKDVCIFYQGKTIQFPLKRGETKEIRKADFE